MKNNQNNSWAKLLSEAVATKDKLPQGKGWMTTIQISTLENLSVCQTAKKLKVLIRDGKVEHCKGVENGKHKVWYRPIKGRTKAI